MELLFPCKTVSLSDAKVGSLIALTGEEVTHYGVVCIEEKYGTNHISIVELTPQRKRSVDISNATNVLEIANVRIDLVPSKLQSQTFEIPKNGADMLGLEGDKILAPYGVPYGPFQVANLRTGEGNGDWDILHTIWFPHWRIVIDD